MLFRQMALLEGSYAATVILVCSFISSFPTFKTPLITALRKSLQKWHWWCKMVEASVVDILYLFIRWNSVACRRQVSNRISNSISNVMDKMKITQSISIATPGAVMSLCQFMACFSTCQYSSLVTNIFGFPTSTNIVLFVVHFWKAIQMIKTL